MGPLSSCSPRVERLVSVSAACSVICFRGGHACHAAEPGRGPGRSPVLCIHPVPIGCTLRARRCSKDTALESHRPAGATDTWTRDATRFPLGADGGEGFMAVARALGFQDEG